MSARVEFFFDLSSPWTRLVFRNIQPLLDNKFPYYVENMVNRGLCLKFSSKVTDWDKFVTDWTKGGRPDAALVRDFCLDDPQWRGWARKEMQSLVRKNMGNSPLAYNIRDELSRSEERRVGKECCR